MHCRIMSSVIFSKQFGFRKAHSTTHALLSMVERLRKCLDNGQFAIGVFVDLQKAFDTVDHHILCGKLDHYGIRGNARQWFSSYLSSQFVSVSNTESSLKSVSHGSGFGLGSSVILDLHKWPPFMS